MLAQILDATLVAAPKQRNTNAEKADLRAERIPEDWQDKPHLKPMPRHIQRSNAGKSVIRSRVEHVFADQKSQTGLFVRTVGITRATMRIGLANIVYNMRRFLLLERINAAA